jgi:hypothetical protein
VPKKYVKLTLAALVATLTLAAGCSSDDAATSSGEAGSATTASSDQSSLWTGPAPNTDPMSDEDAAAIDTAATGSLAANAGQGHIGQIIGWESFAAYNTQTGDVFVGLINETGSLANVVLPVLAGIYPDLAAQLA